MDTIQGTGGLSLLLLQFLPVLWDPGTPSLSHTPVGIPTTESKDGKDGTLGTQLGGKVKQSKFHSVGLHKPLFLARSLKKTSAAANACNRKNIKTPCTCTWTTCVSLQPLLRVSHGVGARSGSSRFKLIEDMCGVSMNSSVPFGDILGCPSNSVNHPDGGSAGMSCYKATKLAKRKRESV